MNLGIQSVGITTKKFSSKEEAIGFIDGLKSAIYENFSTARQIPKDELNRYIGNFITPEIFDNLYERYATSWANKQPSVIIVDLTNMQSAVLGVAPTGKSNILWYILGGGAILLIGVMLFRKKK
jgi:LPXTG-motif cell wall-anchored protein